jgi:hypothetical protein
MAMDLRPLVQEPTANSPTAIVAHERTATQSCFCPGCRSLWQTLLTRCARRHQSDHQHSSLKSARRRLRQDPLGRRDEIVKERRRASDPSLAVQRHTDPMRCPTSLDPAHSYPRQPSWKSHSISRPRTECDWLARCHVRKVANPFRQCCSSAGLAHLTATRTCRGRP